VEITTVGVCLFTPEPLLASPFSVAKEVAPVISLLYLELFNTYLSQETFLLCKSDEPYGVLIHFLTYLKTNLLI